MKRIFLFAFFLFTLLGKAQSDSLFQNLLLSPGINSSRLASDTLSFSNAVMAQFGVGTHGMVAPKIDLLLAAQFSTRGGLSTSPYQKFRGLYTDFIVLPRYQLMPRVLLGAGVQYAMHVSTFRILLDGSTDGTIREKVSGYKSRPEIITSLQVNAWKRIGLELRYSLPLKFTSHSNLQLAAHIQLGIRRDTDAKEPSKRDEKFVVAYEQIREMKNGVVLVRLQSGKAGIEALRKAGNEAAAQRREEAQQRNNKVVMRAYEEQFRFCPVYFFYSDQSQLILDGKIDSVNFLNNDLQADPTKSVAGKKYYILEFADTGDDNSGTGRESLVVLDPKFVMLAKPFPATVRASYTGFNPEQISAAVKRMNESLNSFYQASK